MTEPDPEVSPGRETTEEGLTEAFGRLAIRNTPQPPAVVRNQYTGPRQRGDLPNIELTPGVTRGCILTIPDGQTLADLDRNLNRRFPGGSVETELRAYVVWLVPRYQGPLILAGLHIGRNSRAYAAILAANGDIFEGIRFRRVPSLSAGRVAFLSEARRRQVEASRAEVVYWWG